MNLLQNILQNLSYLFRWWFVVLPWEQGVRVRLGKHTRTYAAGIHFMVPFIDRPYVQNTRMRISPVPAQTITTADGKTVTACGSLRYRLADVLKLYQTLHQAEETLGQQVVGLVSGYVIRHKLAECTPEKVAAAVTSQLNLEQYGLADASFNLTDFAVVRTYRLVNSGMGDGRYVSHALDTNTAANSAPSGPR